MLARMWHIPDGLLTPTTEDYGCATIIGRLWLPKRVQRLRTGLQPCLRRQPRVVDEQPRRSPEISNNQNTERGDHGLTSAGSRSASEPDRVAGSVAKNQPTSRFSLNLFSLVPVERAAHEHLVSNACLLSDVAVDSTIYNTISIPISIPIY